MGIVLVDLIVDGGSGTWLTVLKLLCASWVQVANSSLHLCMKISVSTMTSNTHLCFVVLVHIELESDNPSH